MPAYNFGSQTDTEVDPFYPDGYVSTDQSRQQMIANKQKYEPSVSSINMKWPLGNFRQGFFQGNKDTISAIREDIKVLLMTIKGERVMHRNMGTSLPILDGQLFEPTQNVEVTEKIRMEIESQIEIYLPFISLQGVNIFTNEDDDSLKINQVRVSMSYLVRDTQAMRDNYSFTVTAT